MPALLDMTGRPFGRLTVEGRVGANASGHATWRCRCDCGGRSVVSGRDLRDGSVASCGCRQGGPGRHDGRAAARVRRRLRAERRAEAARLRGMGMTLAEVGERLGVSRQAAQQLLGYRPAGRPPGRPRKDQG